MLVHLPSYCARLPNDMTRVHLVIPAHIGKAAYHLAANQYEEAIRIGEAGLAIAENTGFIVWAAHRLLPLIGEAYLQIHDAEAGLHIEQRMRRYGKKLSTRSGLAWLSAFEAVKTWYAGDIERAAVLLRKAAEELEAIPMIYDAARLRRQLAGRLADLGDREAAMEELRRVHDVFQRIGAEPELKKTRGMFGEMDARPPNISKGSGAEALSQRELEIARLVARRKSNKAIAKELGISPRTVSTHLSNTFQKLEIASRGELADYAREHRLLSTDVGS
jgi:DNA-binding CsgD family transcriptional regulator